MDDERGGRQRKQWTLGLIPAVGPGPGGGKEKAQPPDVSDGRQGGQHLQNDAAAGLGDEPDCHGGREGRWRWRKSWLFFFCFKG